MDQFILGILGYTKFEFYFKREGGILGDAGCKTDIIPVATCENGL